MKDFDLKKTMISITILLFVNLFFTLISLFSVFFFKYKKIKSDILLIEKQLLKSLFELYLVFFFISKYYKNENSEANIVLPIFYSANFLLYFYICLQRYYTLKDPFSVVNSYLTKDYSNTYYQEISIIILTTLLLVNGYMNSDIFTRDNKKIYMAIICGFLLLITILTSILIFLERKLVNNIPKNFQKNIKTVLKCELLENLFLYPQIIFILLEESILIQNDPWLNYTKFIIILLNLFLEDLFTMKKIYNSEFYFFIVGPTRIGWFYKIFGNKFHDKPAISHDLSASFISSEFSIQFLFEKGFYIESYVLNLCDNTIQTFFSCLLTSYKKYNGNYSSREYCF